MTDDDFWSVVERAKRRAGNQAHARLSTLRDELRMRSRDDVARFHEQMLLAHRELMTQPFIAAAQICTGSDETDACHSVAVWVISEGRETHQRAKSQPDSLAAYQVRQLSALLADYGSIAAELLASHGIDAEDLYGVEVPPISLSPEELTAQLPGLATRISAAR